MRIAVVIVSLLLLTGCGDSATPTAETVLAEEAEGPPPDHEAWDIVYRISEEGRPRVTVTAAHFARFETQDSLYALLQPHPDSSDGRVHAQLYDEDGNPSAVLTADEILHFERQHRFNARGRVVVVTEADERLETERLDWTETERRITSPGFVRITTPTETIQGYELDAAEDLSEYTIFRITGRVLVEE